MMGKKRERAHHGKNVKCRRCGRAQAVIRKYGLMLCRHCFKLVAEELGFKNYY